MREHHEFCQLRIDGLKDTIATLTAQRDAALREAAKWQLEAEDNGEYVGEIAEELDAAEKVCEAADQIDREGSSWAYLRPLLADWRRTKEG